MKVYVSCNSPLLQKTMSGYLKDFLSDYRDCDFIVSDVCDDDESKPICLVDFSENSDISRPIHKDSVINDISHFDEHLSEIPRADVKNFEHILDMREIDNLKSSLASLEDSAAESNELRDEIESIVQDFTDRLYNVMKKMKHD